MSVSQRRLVRAWLQHMAGTDDVNLTAESLDFGESCYVFRITPVDRSTAREFYLQPVVEVVAVARASAPDKPAPTGTTEAMCRKILDFIADYPVTLDLVVDGVRVDCAQPTVESPPVERGSSQWAEHRMSISLPYQA